MTLIIEILKAISDSKSLVIFNTIAHSSNSTTDLLNSKLKFTRKQYYSRLSALTKAGLLQRKSGKYSLTSLGKINYDVQLSVEKAVNNYWNLKAIDSLLISNNFRLRRREIVKIVDSLVQDPKIRKIILAQVKSLSSDNRKYLDNTNENNKTTKSFRRHHFTKTRV